MVLCACSSEDVPIYWWRGIPPQVRRPSRFRWSSSLHGEFRRRFPRRGSFQTFSWIPSSQNKYRMQCVVRNGNGAIHSARADRFQPHDGLGSKSTIHGCSWRPARQLCPREHRRRRRGSAGTILPGRIHPESGMGGSSRAARGTVRNPRRDTETFGTRLEHIPSHHVPFLRE